MVLTESANSGIGSGNLYSFSAAQIRFDFLVLRSNEETGVLGVVVDKEEGSEVHKFMGNKKFEGRATTVGALQIPQAILLSTSKQTGFLLSSSRVYLFSFLVFIFPSLSLVFFVWEIKGQIGLSAQAF